jgi:hypothetical protein
MKKEPPHLFILIILISNYFIQPCHTFHGRWNSESPIGTIIFFIEVVDFFLLFIFILFYYLFLFLFLFLFYFILFYFILFFTLDSLLL